MIALDTNILVRYLMQDDPIQSAAAEKLMRSLTAERPGFVSLVNLAEFYWVLDHTYKFPAQQIVKALIALISSETVVLEESLRVQRALQRYQTSRIDFDDALIAETAEAFGCDYVATFDKIAAKSGAMKLLL